MGSLYVREIGLSFETFNQPGQLQAKKKKKKEISSKPIQHYPIVDLDDIKKENIGESGERRGESRQGGSSQIAILAIPELGAGGRRSTK